MAKRVALGHLKIEDDNLGLHPKMAFLKSKNSKTDGKKGGSRIAGRRKRKALNDNDTTKKESPQPEASFIMCETHTNIGRSRCFEEVEAVILNSLMNSILENGLPHGCISIQEQKKVPGSPQCSSLEPIQPAEFPDADPDNWLSDWLDAFPRRSHHPLSL